MTEAKIEKQIETVVKKYLKGLRCRVFLFGSRATGRDRRFSDLDLGVLGKEKIPSHLMVKIKSDLENSSIPYKIDIVDFKRVSDEFRNLALSKIKYL
ncbi:nucleotidyltransferase domain-containing protein [Patescibacteria group bacterium]|nr:nucleotidyltransferase domain-containing protein [Patescibacteria group bacterium]MBU1473004.1 nucleotidyltransferase domain-containing protein [Patescibacteria group bacterium]MBU2460339.1 nucleotidyltransferase domain-containing protein [Patescibacteria group bacterium]MBU2544517.1 nucleotidyltransferase domain-containing protein [Patescibacteria group bacterium]